MQLGTSGPRTGQEHETINFGARRSKVKVTRGTHRAHTIATATEVSRLPVTKFGISFHRDFYSRDFYFLHFKNI